MEPQTKSTSLMSPCPCCGKQETVKIVRSSDDENFDFSHDDYYAIFCDASKPFGPSGCGASGGYRATLDEAIEVWNRRPSAPKASAVPKFPRVMHEEGSGPYEVIGVAIGAGPSKVEPGRVIYRRLSDGQLFYRYGWDFGKRMKPVDSAPQAEEAPAALKGFNPDWDQIQAARDSVREHMDIAREAIARAEKAEAQLAAIRAGVEGLTRHDPGHYFHMEEREGGDYLNRSEALALFVAPACDICAGTKTAFGKRCDCVKGASA